MYMIIIYVEIIHTVVHITQHGTQYISVNSLFVNMRFNIKTKGDYGCKLIVNTKYKWSIFNYEHAFSDLRSNSYC